MTGEYSVQTRHGSFHAEQRFNSVMFRMESKSAEIHRFKDIAHELEQTGTTLCIDITGDYAHGKYGFEFHTRIGAEEVRKAAGEFIRIYDHYMYTHYPNKETA